MTLPRTAAFAAGLVLAASMTACGAIEDLIPEKNDFAKGTAKEIFAAAKASVDALDSVHVAGSFRDQGKSLQMDVSVSRSGECRGTFDVQKLHFDLLVAEKRVFFRPDAAYYRKFGQSPALADQTVAFVGDRWIEDKSGKIGKVCDFDELFDVSDKGIKNLRSALPGKVEVGEGAAYVGQESVSLTSTGPKGNFTMTIATEEPHHILGLTAINTHDVDGQATFSDHDIPVDTQIPPADQIIKIPTGG
jgi:hypothetical protein